MHEIIIAMMHNPPEMVELLQGTEQSCMDKVSMVNHVCMHWERVISPRVIYRKLYNLR